MEDKSRACPRVVACLPTYNSANFVADTLQSLAEQTYPNLQILISDDASPDDTVGVCEQVAKDDPRFSVIRQPRNLGWIGNTNALLQAAEGDYLFRAGHDDLYAPDFVARLVDSLEHHADAVLAFSDEKHVANDGSFEIRAFQALDSVDDDMDRAAAIALRSPNWSVPGGGIVRSSAVRLVGGLRRHLKGEIGADWPWLLGLALLGRFVHVPQILHAKVHNGHNLSGSWKRNRWSLSALTLSALKQVHDAPIPLQEKLRLYVILERFGWRALKTPLWSDRRRRAIREIKRHVPKGSTLILVDEDRLQLRTMAYRTVVPFLEEQGRYWGPPPDDEHAIKELHQMIDAGATYIVFCWPTFWWLDYYKAFHRRLRSMSRGFFENDDLVVFRLTR